MLVHKIIFAGLSAFGVAILLQGCVVSGPRTAVIAPPPLTIPVPTVSVSTVTVPTPGIYMTGSPGPRPPHYHHSRRW